MKVTVDIDNIDDNSIDVLVFACKLKILNYLPMNWTHFLFKTF